LDDVIRGEKQAQDTETVAEESFLGTLVPMETFLVNLAGSRGGKLAKVNLELEVDGHKIDRLPGFLSLPHPNN